MSDTMKKYLWVPILLVYALGWFVFPSLWRWIHGLLWDWAPWAALLAYIGLWVLSRPTAKAFHATLWQHKVRSFVLAYWLAWVFIPTPMTALHTYRPLVLELSDALSIPQNDCTDKNKVDVTCRFYKVFADGNEFRNHDMATWLGKIFIKTDASRLQNDLHHTIGKGPQVSWGTGFRIPLFTWYPHLITHPTPLAEVWYNTTMVWWGLLAARLLMVGVVLWWTFSHLRDGWRTMWAFFRNPMAVMQQT